MAGLNFNYTANNGVACTYIKSLSVAYVDGVAQATVKVGAYTSQSDYASGHLPVDVFEDNYVVPFDATSALSFQQQIDTGLLAITDFSGSTQA